MRRPWGLLLAGALALGLACRPAAADLTAEARWLEGSSLLKQGKAAEAKAAFESLLEKYPADADLYLFLAIAELRLRDPRAAEFRVGKALILAPQHVEARTLLGWIQLEVHQDYDAAIAEYAKVTKLRPDFPEGHNNLGVARQKKGDLPKALESFNRALELRPDYSEALNNRGWVYVKEKNWPKARADFEHALRIEPRHEGALYGLAQVARETRDYARAQKSLALLTAQSSNFVYWLERAEIQLLRYYWVLILLALGLFVRARYKNSLRRTFDGR